MMITPTTKINTGISIVLLLCAAGVVVFGIAYLQKLGAELEEQVAAVASQTDREQKYAELSRIAESSVAQRAELAGYILHREDAPDFVTAGEQMAADQGVAYETISLKEVEVEDDFDQLEMVFTMEGREADVRHVLKSLETLPYHSMITKVEIDRSKLQSSGEVKMNITLMVTLGDV